LQAAQPEALAHAREIAAARNADTISRRPKARSAAGFEALVVPFYG